MTLAATVGGQTFIQESQFGPNEINAGSVECCIADLMALIQVASSELGAGDYELQLGFEWRGQPATDLTMLAFGLGRELNREGVANLSTTAPMITTIRTDLDEAAYRDQVVDLSIDVLNTGGILGPQL